MNLSRLDAMLWLLGGQPLPLAIAMLRETDPAAALDLAWDTCDDPAALASLGGMSSATLVRLGESDGSYVTRLIMSGKNHPLIDAGLADRAVHLTPKSLLKPGSVRDAAACNALRSVLTRPTP